MNTAINNSLAKYFLQFLFTKIVIPAQAGIGTLNRAQRAPIKYFLNFLAPIPAFAGMTSLNINFLSRLRCARFRVPIPAGAGMTIFVGDTRSGSIVL